MDALELKLFSEIYTPIRASIYRVSNQTGVVAATVTQIQFDTIEYDYANIVVSLGTVNAGFKIPTSGWYLISGCVGFSMTAAANGQSFFTFNKNAVNTFNNVVIGSQMPTTNAGGTLNHMVGGGIVQLNVGDLVGAAGSCSGTGGSFIGGAAETYMRIMLLQEGLS